ncbi:MAG: hypothetical protein ACQEQ4_09820 [Fibrobacterota bacterium]
MISNLGPGISGKNPYRAMGNSSPKTTQKTPSQGVFNQSDSLELTGRDSQGIESQISMMQEKTTAFDISRYTNPDQNTGKSISEKTAWNFQSTSTISMEISVTQSGDASDMSTEDIIGELPDTWKPEGVADSIMNFVKGFEGETDAEGKEFYNLVKDSVKAGTEKALKMLEGFPDSVIGVAQETADVLTQRLDEWGIEQGWVEEESTDTDAQSGGSTIDVSA